MRMNSGIILAGQQPDFVNVLRQSNAAAGEANQVRTQNALRELYQTQGPQIAAGEQGAMNALSRFDPKAALGIQGDRQGLEAGALNMDATRLGMSATQQRMDILSSEEKRAVQESAARLSAVERAAAAEKVQQGLMTGIQLHQAGDLPGLNALLQSVGEQPIQSLDQFPGVAVKYKGVLDALSSVEEFNNPKDGAPASIQALRIRAQEAGLQPGTPEYASFMAKGGKTNDGMRITQSPDGGLVFEQGDAVSGTSAPKMTVDAAKNTGFLVRVRESNKILNDLEDQGTRFGQQNLDKVPLGLGNYGRDTQFQQFDQARRDFVNAILRRESGAVIADSEFENANQQYFPVPGDSPEVIKQKRQNRQNAIRGIQVGSGDGAAYIDAQDAAAPPPEQTPEAFDPQTPDFSQMSDEELQAYIEGGGK